MARLVVAAAAAVIVGIVTENPYAALQTFALVYGATGFLDPNKRILGPKLNDLKAPQASYGAPIAYLRGYPRLAGVFFWASEKREIATTTTQGKGGPGVDSTTFTYEIDCLIGLACNRCYGIRRIWSNGLLVWSNGDDADAETIIASSETNSWRDMRFYGGADDQLPDPTYEAAMGIGHAPAYRKRATVFIEGLNLGGSGQLPILTFEVIAEPFEFELAAQERGYPANSVAGPGAIGPGITAYNANPLTLHIPQWNANYIGTTVWVYDMSVDPPNQINGYELIAPNWHNQTTGTADVSCYVTTTRSTADVTAEIYFDDGTALQYIFTGVPGASYRDRVAIRGDDVIFGQFSQNAPSGSFDGDLKLYGCKRSDVYTFVFSAPLARIQSLAISSDGFVYAVDLNGTSLYKLDVATLTLQETIAMPVTGETVFVVLCDDADVYIRSFTFRKYNGSGWDTIVGTLPVEMRLGSIYDQPGAVVDGILYTLDTSPDGPPFAYQIWALAQTIPQEPAALDDVVLQMWLRTKQYGAADIDVTALAGQYVRAMAVSQPVPTRQPIETLMASYFFEFVEGPKLKAVLRGGAPAATVPYEDLAASQDGKGEPLPIRRLNDVELPAFVTAKYANVLNDFQDGTERSDRLVTESTAETVIEIPLGFTPTEARRIAEGNAMDIAVSILQIGPVALTREYSKIEPTDVLILTGADGSLFRARVTKATTGGGVFTAELVLDDASAILSTIETDSDYTSSTLLRRVAATEMTLMDIPILRDVDDGPGIYAGVKPIGTGRWPGAEVDKSLDDVTYSKVLEVATRTIMGTADSTLGDFTGGNIFDEVNTLTVDVGEDTLSSSTRDLLLTTNVNALLVGAEIIQFRTAALLSPGVYLLSGLRRGLRGTEWTMPDHVADEQVVLLETATLRRVVDSQADVDVPYYWKAVTFGRSRASVLPETFTDTGVGQMPFAPVDLRVSASKVLTWHRRSRLASRFLAAGIDPPLGETTESYDVEIRDSGDVLIESGTVSTASYTIVATPGAGDYITVWQKSQQVGRGYSATLTF